MYVLFGDKNQITDKQEHEGETYNCRRMAAALQTVMGFPSGDGAAEGDAKKSALTGIVSPQAQPAASQQPAGMQKAASGAQPAAAKQETTSESANLYTKARRNELIDMLIATSNRKCTRYTSLLKNADGALNSSLSIGAIIAGGLGAFVGGPNAAKALSGTSAILSGSREAINQTYLSNLTIHVLAAAIEKARDRTRRDITNRQACSIESYTLSRGIEDSFQYHDACSINAALAEAATAIERSQNPGFDALRNTFAQYLALSKQVQDGEAITQSPDLSPGIVPDLKSVNEAVSKRDKSKTAVADAVKVRDALKTKAEEARKTAGADLANAALKKAEDELNQSETSLKKLENEQRELEKSLSGEWQQLASSITFAQPSLATPETRQCPFGAGQ